MIMNALAIGIILISAYMWLLRGFFSAFIHLMCAVTAGAIALAVFEPLGLLILKNAGDRGFFAELQLASAWAIALAVPYILSYAIFRGALDGFLRRNVFLNQTMNYVGGGVCGALAGVVMSGITVMSIGFLRLPADMGMFDYRAVEITPAGSVQRGTALWVPTDRLTSWLYGHASRNVYYTDDNLATFYPALYASVGASRYAAVSGDNRARNNMKPGAFSIVNSYIVDPPASVTGKARLDELTKDRWTAPQSSVTRFNGENADPASKLYGYVVNFGTAAREKNGQVVVGNAQIYLLAADAVGDTTLVFPNAALLKAQPPVIDPNDARARRRQIIEYSRFAFGSGGDGKFYPSVGADAASNFGFEFLVPPGYTPKALYVKGHRAMITDAPEQTYTTALARDQAIDILMGGGERVTNLDESSVNLVTRGSGSNRVVDTPPEGFAFTITNQIGIQLQRDTLQGGTIVPGRGGGMIQDGDFKLNPKETTTSGLDPALKVDKYEPVENQLVCQLDVSMTNEWKLGERGFANDAPVYLIDDKGRKYQAIGFFYRDGDIVQVRYTPGTPVPGMEALPKPLSRSEPGQQCKFIFRVSRGVVITGLGIGDKLAIKWEPKFRVDGNQMTR
jgi:hypothetical protein